MVGGGLVVVLAGVVLVVAPPAVDQARAFSDEVPATVESLYSWPVVGDRLQDADAVEQVEEWMDDLPARFDDELNIRGERVEPALEKVRDFVTEAHALKAERVRILHGKGTGTLREVVRDYLKNERRVERYEDATPYEGGHGVTVAYLRS